MDDLRDLYRDKNRKDISSGAGRGAAQCAVEVASAGPDNGHGTKGCIQKMRENVTESAKKCNQKFLAVWRECLAAKLVLWGIFSIIYILC